jgi:ribosomal protein RSM22 (predicted rRNA methylase)
MELPLTLRIALDRALEHVKPSDLARATSELSDRYRERDDRSQFLRSDMDVLAYGAYRLPATYAAVSAALAAVKDVMPDWHPRSLLDVGAGPGTAAWAAGETWSSVKDVELVEEDERMVAFGKHLMNEAEGTILSAARWSKKDLLDPMAEEQRDLIIAAYVLGELDATRRRPLLKRLWKDSSGVLMLVEPGTPAGFEVLRAARVLLIQWGAHVVAPCPHSSACPMANGDWCHFSRRLARSRAHRDAKDVTMGYEDEKYSYVAVTGMSVAPVHSRVLRHPQVRPGHIRLELCTRDGLQHSVVTKKDKAQFREARHANWGSAIRLSRGAEDRDPAAASQSQNGP